MNKVKVLILFTLIITAIGGLLLFSKKETIVSGTEGRTEEEYKISYSNTPENFSEEKVYSLIKKKLDLVLKRSEFKDIQEIVSNQFYVTEGQDPLVFIDYYFDDHLALYNSLRMYRLRYRFKSQSEFYSYTKIQDKNSYPIRCEIQLKVYDEIKDDYFRSQEYRFEFRSESPPFNPENNPAPPPPWPIKQFLTIAQKGQYKSYTLLPYHKLGEKVSLKNNAHLITKRKRFHLNIKTPWGTGPNPEQAFIISIDHSLVPKNGKEFNEVEIEFERNVSTKLEQLSSTDMKIKKINRQFKSLLKLIYKELKEELLLNNFAIGSSMTKYRRTMTLTNEKRLQ